MKVKAVTVSGSADGGIDPVHFLTLLAQELDKYVEETLDEASEDGFILANSNSWPPGVGEWKFSRIMTLVTRRTRSSPEGSLRAPRPDDHRD
jgi:hypothetical protein